MDKRIVIVGAGIAGLSAGIYAIKAGYKAEIYEKNSIAGGECMGWNRKGYHIDNCIHWLTGTNPGTDLWKVWKTVGAIDENTEYADTDKFYSSRIGGKEASLYNDLQKTEEELIRVAPEDEAEIRKFIEYVEYSKQCIFPAGKPMEMWGIKDYINMGKNMADFPKVMKEFGKISLEEYSRKFKNPLMQKMICDYLPKEYTAYSFLVSYATMADGNGGIPMGACAARAHVAAVFEPGLHGSTFGGSCLAVAAANTVLDTIETEGIAQNVEEVGAYLREQLAELPHIVEVRGLGLMVAAEFDETVDAPAVVLNALNAGLLLNATGPHTLRFLPPLVCTRKDVDELIERLRNLL